MEDFLLQEQIRKLEEVLRLKRLNLELLDTLEAIIFWLYKYTEEHKIPLREKDNLRTLLRMARNLVDEIASHPQLPKVTTFKFDDKKPEELPEC